MITKMRAIDFNTWMTLLAMVRGRVIEPAIMDYAIVLPQNVLPEFPRDLTKFKKPSIIIQKVATDQSDIGFGKGFLGQVWDETLSLYIDVFGRQHEMTFQYDVFSDTNTQDSLLTSVISEEILGLNRELKIFDFIADINNPTEMGIAKIMHCVDIIPLTSNLPPTSNENKDYRTAIRFHLNVIQTVIPEQEIIDLSKWIRISQHVII